MQYVLKTESVLEMQMGQKLPQFSEPLFRVVCLFQFNKNYLFAIIHKLAGLPGFARDHCSIIILSVRFIFRTFILICFLWR